MSILTKNVINWLTLEDLCALKAQNPGSIIRTSIVRVRYHGPTNTRGSHYTVKGLWACVDQGIRFNKDYAVSDNEHYAREWTEAVTCQSVGFGQTVPAANLTWVEFTPSSDRDVCYTTYVLHALVCREAD
jgi:hypothetical protein